MPELGFAKTAARGVAVTGFAQIMRLGVQLATLIVLSRLLLPDEFGIVVMVTAIIGLAEVIRDFGLSAAAVQAKKISQAQRSNLFWLNLAIGGTLTIIVYLCASPISSFYDNPLLTPIVQVLSATFFLNGICAQSKAQLLRSFKYGRASSADLVGQSVGFVVAVVLAVNGASYWALVWQQFVGVFVTCIFFLVAAQWIPQWPVRRAGIRELTVFGSFFTLTQVMVYLSANAGSIAIGKILGPLEVGLYSRAFQVASLPLNQVSTPATNVALATLSRLLDDKKRYLKFLIRGQIGLSHPVICAFMFIAAFSAQLIELVFGNAWIPMSPILSLLCIGGAFQVLSYSTYWCFVSTGNARSNFWYALLSRSVLLVVTVACSFAGPTACALGYAVHMAVFWPMGVWWVSRFGYFKPMDLIGPGARALFGYGLAAGAALMAYYIDGSLVVVLVGATLYLLAIAVYSFGSWKFRSDIMSIVDIGRLIVQRNR